jgi:acylphosphatase
MNKNIIIKISGRVQGVWFRKSAQNEARQLGVSGFARNNVDDTVTIEACGEENNIKELLKWSYKGSKFARVDNVKYEIDDNCGDINYKEFKIL